LEHLTGGILGYEAVWWCGRTPTFRM